MVNEIKTSVAKSYSPLENKSHSKSQDSTKASGDNSNEKSNTQQVSLSEELTSLTKAINDGPDVDVDKVSAVSKQVSEGTYQIDPKAIAEKLLKDFS